MPCGPQAPRSNIPKSDLDDVLQMYRDNDPAPITVDVKLDADGTYTVQAIFPPCPPKKATTSPSPSPASANGGTGKTGAASGVAAATGTSGATGASGAKGSTEASHAAIPSRPAAAQRSAPQYGSFPADVVAAAKAGETNWKVLASISLAQWALESAWGTRMPRGSNNPFGMKATGSEPFVSATTKEFRGGRYVTLVAKFRAFQSLEEAFDAHAKLLATRAPYKKAMAVASDPMKFADALTGAYATDPHYGESLQLLIKKYKLTQYD